MYKKFIFLPAISLVLFSVLFSACNKTSDLGINLIPDKYILDLNSQTVIGEAYTYKYDPIITHVGNTTGSSGYYYGIIGSINDPILGTLKSSFVTEMRPTGILSLETTAVYDSVVLFLQYDSTVVKDKYYGNDAISVTINISENTKKLSLDSNYYSNFDPGLFNAVLKTSKDFKPHQVFLKPIVYQGDTMRNTLAIKLDSLFGKRFFDDAKVWNGNITFSDYFKGLYISSNSSPIDASLSIFNLRNQYSRLSIYYKNSPTDTVLRRYDFTFGNLCVNFNMYEHNFNAPGFLPDLDHPEATQDTVVYLQGLVGLKAKIRFPYLDKLKDEGSWIVNRAELVLQTGSNTIEDNFPVPPEVNLYTVEVKNDKDSLILLQEYTLTSTDTYGNQSSQYLGAGYDSGRYIFDITFLVQKILNGKVPNRDFIIQIKNGVINPARVVLTSGNNSKPMKLVLSLTKP
jgi:hypothetical protein